MKVMLSGLGKAGKELTRTFSQADDIDLVGGICREGSRTQGMDLGELAGMDPLHVQVYGMEQLHDFIKFVHPDAIVDFSSPALTMQLVDLCQEYGIDLVIGTTGFSADQLNELKELSLSGDIAILYAPNITLGVNVLIAMVQLAAKHLTGYDFSITEVHYKGKLDSPSGTAKAIFKAIDQNMETQHGEIGLHSVRAGGYIGRHEVMAVGENDKIVLIHESFSRKAFADGALVALRGIAGRQGWLEMKDVIRFHN